MSRRRVSPNIVKFNEGRSRHILPLIEDELRLMRRRKREFGSVGTLADEVGRAIGTHRTTLLRNPRYKALLLEYLAGLPGAALRVSDDTNDSAVLRVKLASTKAQLVNLRETVKQLTAILEHQERPVEGVAARTAYADVAMVLVGILDRCSSFLTLDVERRQLIDLSARPSDRVVADAERLGEFCEWLHQQGRLPMVSRLLGK